MRAVRRLCNTLAILQESYQLWWDRGRILNEYQIIYLVEGNGIFENRTVGTVNLEAGSFIVIYPDYWHRYKPVGNELWHTY